MRQHNFVPGQQTITGMATGIAEKRQRVGYTSTKL